MITISLPRVLELLNEAVEERGEDYVDGGSIPNRGCTYVSEGKPGCIVGLVFYKAGASVDTLSLLDRKGSLHCMGPTFLRNSYGIDLDGQAFEVLTQVQRKQDLGIAWGLAVSNVVSALPATV